MLMMLLPENTQTATPPTMMTLTTKRPTTTQLADFLVSTGVSTGGFKSYPAGTTGHYTLPQSNLE